ncbi:unnamed protein product, partial [Pocillopora meandrina]
MNAASSRAVYSNNRLKKHTADYYGNDIQCYIEESISRYIQAPDVCWNKLFKAACTEKYDEWLSTPGIHKETAAGN